MAAARSPAPGPWGSGQRGFRPGSTAHGLCDARQVPEPLKASGPHLDRADRVSILGLARIQR